MTKSPSLLSLIAATIDTLNSKAAPAAEIIVPDPSLVDPRLFVLILVVVSCLSAVCGFGWGIALAPRFNPTAKTVPRPASRLQGYRSA